MRHYTVEAEAKLRAKRKNIFVHFLEALHRSRRREAIRVLRRYRHLNPGQAQLRPANPAPEARQSEKSSRNANGNTTSTRADRRARQDAGTRFA
jgi:hypothetical protein